MVDLIADLDSVPKKIQTAVRNNGGGHANHSLFFTLFAPDGSDQPQGEFARTLDDALGGFDAFKQAFTEAATGRFGGGWAWLSLDRGKLIVESTPNQDSPRMSGRVAKNYEAQMKQGATA